MANFHVHNVVWLFQSGVDLPWLTQVLKNPFEGLPAWYRHFGLKIEKGKVIAQNFVR